MQTNEKLDVIFRIIKGDNSYEEIARITGRSLMNTYCYFSGRRYDVFLRIKYLCDVLHIDVDDLIDILSHDIEDIEQNFRFDFCTRL